MVSRASAIASATRMCSSCLLQCLPVCCRIKAHVISYTFVGDEFLPNPNADYHALTARLGSAKPKVAASRMSKPHRSPVPGDGKTAVKLVTKSC
jgi:hypothetical protein